MVFIFVCTFGLIYYFKGALKIQENRNEQIKGSSFSLSQLREWETEYLNLSNEDKISIDEAIHITIIRYSLNFVPLQSNIAVWNVHEKNVKFL